MLRNYCLNCVIIASLLNSMYLVLNRLSSLCNFCIAALLYESIYNIYNNGQRRLKRYSCNGYGYLVWFGKELFCCHLKLIGKRCTFHKDCIMMLSFYTIPLRQPMCIKHGANHNITLHNKYEVIFCCDIKPIWFFDQSVIQCWDTSKVTNNDLWSL